MVNFYSRAILHLNNKRAKEPKSSGLRPISVHSSSLISGHVPDRYRNRGSARIPGRNLRNTSTLRLSFRIPYSYRGEVPCLGTRRRLCPVHEKDEETPAIHFLAYSVITAIRGTGHGEGLISINKGKNVSITESSAVTVPALLIIWCTI